MTSLLKDGLHVSMNHLFLLQFCWIENKCKIEQTEDGSGFFQWEMMHKKTKVHLFLRNEKKPTTKYACGTFSFILCGLLT